MPSSKYPIPTHCSHPLGDPPPHLEAQDDTKAQGFCPPLATTQLKDAFARDDFRMYDYKVRRCMRAKSHDWTNCPFAHRGEKARRRDPRRILYSGEPCPNFRKGTCSRGDACMYAHGVFECWLHPAKYRTQACKDGKNCRRKVCFFAHSMQQLRHVAEPVEQSLVEGALITDFHTHEPYYAYLQELGSPVDISSLEDSSRHKVSRADLYEQYEVRMALSTNSSALSSGDACNATHVHFVSETIPMPTWSSPTPNLSSSPFEQTSPIGFSSSHAVGVPLEVHSPSPINLFSVAPGLTSSGLGVICDYNPSLFEQSVELPMLSSGPPSPQVVTKQAVLMRKGSDMGGEPILNVSTGEVSDMVHYRSYGDSAHGYVNESRQGRLDPNEVSNELSGVPKLILSSDQLALFGKDLSSYKSCGTYGLPSPTSTLAEPFYLSSFSSPPLSPSNTPSSNTSNMRSPRGHGNMVQVDGGILNANAHILSGHAVKELESKHVSPDQEFSHAIHHRQMMGYVDLPQCREFLSICSGCMCRRNKWKPLCVMPGNMQPKVSDRLEEEGPTETAMPDLGWVRELVM